MPFLRVLLLHSTATYVCWRAALFKCSSLTSVFTRTVIRMSNNEALLLWFRLGIIVCLSWPNYHPYWIFLLILLVFKNECSSSNLTAVFFRYHILFKYVHVHLAVTFVITWPRQFSGPHQITFQVRQAVESADDAVGDNDDIITAYI
jgi:hypothetical protein